jgi:hypothetical protein
MSDEAVAKKYILEAYPDCEAAFLAGSSARGEATEHSDIDLIILDSGQTESWHRCLIYQGRPFELFVFNPEELSFQLTVNRFEAVPTFLHMCAEGIVLKGGDHATKMQKAARKHLINGPSGWTRKMSDHLRFTITDLLTDLDASIPQYEKVFTAHKLFDLVPEFLLRANGRWLGHGKWMYRMLNSLDPSFCGSFIEAYQHFISTGESQSFVGLIDQQLEAYGGRLFEGFSEKM